MIRIKSEKYFIVHYWMINALGLKNTALMVYAVIYGFYQSTLHEFNGSIAYLMDITAKKRTAIITALKYLVGKNYIIKQVITVNGRRRVLYYINEDILIGLVCECDGQKTESECSKNEQGVQKTENECSKSEQGVQKTENERSESEQGYSKNEHGCSENEQGYSENEHRCSESEHNNIYNINNNIVENIDNNIDTYTHGVCVRKISPDAKPIIDKWDTPAEINARRGECYLRAGP